METLSEADEREARDLGVFDILAPSLPPQCISASGPSDVQTKIDAWCAAGGYENDEFRAFFGLKAD